VIVRQVYGSVTTSDSAHSLIQPAWEDVVVHAYILVQTEVGKAAEVAARIAEIDGVTQAEDVTGPYDVIVRAQAENVDDLGRLVVAQIQGVDGITRTLTCPVVRL
jgi:DNA-binding Lrp family transcriptional regulator